MTIAEAEMIADVDLRLDVSGVCCPLPLMQLAKAAKGLNPGQTLEITGNDPIFETSIRDFCQANGHTVLEVTTDHQHRVRLLLRVGG
jgi:tRNA 2-thiouridine synthesizing protein A